MVKNKPKHTVVIFWGTYSRNILEIDGKVFRSWFCPADSKMKGMIGIRFTPNTVKTREEEPDF